MGGLYVFLTGSFFLCRVLMPALTRNRPFELRADAASWSPFQSRLTVHGLRFGVAGREPYLTADRAAGRYALLDLLRGHLHFTELTAEHPRLALRRDADGTWNCRPPRRRPRSGPRRGRTYLTLEQIHFREAEVEFLLAHPDGDRRFRLSGADLRANRVGSYTWTRLEAHGRFRVQAGAGVQLDYDRAGFRFDGRLDHWVRPAAWKSELELTDGSGEINRRRLAAGQRLQLQLAGSHEPGRFEVEDLTLRQFRSEQLETELRLGGALYLRPRELRTSWQLRAGNGALISALGQLFFGCNPGELTGEYAGELDYAAGLRFALHGAGEVTGIEPVGAPAPLPFQLRWRHDLALDFPRRHADLKELELVLSADGRKQLELRLDHPAAYSRAHPVPAEAIPELRLQCDRLDLPLLNALPARLLPGRIRGGTLTAAGRLRLPGGTQPSRWEGTLAVADAALTRNGRELPPTGVDATFSGELTRDFRLHLEQAAGSARIGAGRGLGSFQLTGNWDPESRTGRGELQLRELSLGLLEFLPPRVGGRLAFLRELDPFQAELRLVASRNGPDFEVQDLTAQLQGRGPSRVRARVRPFRWSRGAAAPELEGDLSGTIPGAAFQALFPQSPIQMQDGSVRLDCRFQAAGTLERGAVNGQLEVENGEFSGLGWHFRGLAARSDFSLLIPDPATLQLLKFDLHTRVGGHPALHLELPGRYTLTDGSFAGELTLYYLNEHFFELLAPGAVRSALLRGKARMDYHGLERRGSYHGTLALEKLQLSRLRQPLSGRLELAVESSPAGRRIPRFDGELKAPGAPLAVWTGSLDWPLLETGDPVRGQLKFQTLNLGPYPVDPEAPGLPALPERTGPAFDFRRRYELNFEVERLLRGSYHDLQLAGELVLSGREIRIDPLRFRFLQGGSLESTLSFAAADSGAVTFRSTGMTTDYLPVPTLEHLLGRSSGTGCRGEVENLSWELSGPCRRADWTKLNGRLEADFNSLEVPNNYASDLWGQLLFIPLEVLTRLRGILPDRLFNPVEYADAFIRLGALRSNFRTLHFSGGRLAARVRNGALELDNCRLTDGTPVGRMIFSGRIPLTPDDALELNTDSLVGGLVLPVMIRGTLTAPQVNFRRIGTELAAANARNLLEQLSELGGRLLNTDDDREDSAKPPDRPGFWQQLFNFWN